MKQLTSLDELEYFIPFKGLRAKVFHTDTQTYAFWEIDQDTILPEHKHIHEQVSIVTEGELEFTIDGKTQIIKKGMVAYIPSNTQHVARAISHVKITDVFTPVREDFK